MHIAASHVSAILAVAFIIGMAFTAEGVNKVKDRTRWDMRKFPGCVEALRSFWAHLANLGNPDLQFVAFSALETADVVICAAACTVRAIFIKKPAASTTAAWFKGSNHATAASANADISCILPATFPTPETCLVFHDGIPMTTGFTVGSHTSNNGSSKSLVADAPTGFVVISA